ncbi:hypothetical protein RJ640_027173, partial [Escallonia rubra]
MVVFETISLKIHHGGYFTGVPNMEWKGGIVDVLDGMDVDLMSYWELVGIIGLRLITDDNGVMSMLEYYKSTDMVPLYVERVDPLQVIGSDGNVIVGDRLLIENNNGDQEEMEVGDGDVTQADDTGGGSGNFVQVGDDVEDGLRDVHLVDDDMGETTDGQLRTQPFALTFLYGIERPRSGRFSLDACATNPMNGRSFSTFEGGESGWYIDTGMTSRGDSEKRPRGLLNSLSRNHLQSSQMAYELTEQKKIGLGFIGFGVFFSFLGVILFFDRGLLALSNVRNLYKLCSLCVNLFWSKAMTESGIFCLAGAAILLGWRSTLRIFTNRANYKGLEYLEIFESAHITKVLLGSSLKLRWEVKIEAAPNGSFSFLLGLFFIFVRWPILGIILEIYACVVLFGGFWPSVKVFLYQIPVFGWILQYPF